MSQNTSESRKAAVRMWGNMGGIPEFDQNFEINSKKFSYLDLGHFEYRRIDYPYACPPLPLSQYILSPEGRYVVYLVGVRVQLYYLCFNFGLGKL